MICTRKIVFKSENLSIFFCLSLIYTNIGVGKSSSVMIIYLSTDRSIVSSSYFNLWLFLQNICFIQKLCRTVISIYLLCVYMSTILPNYSNVRIILLKLMFKHITSYLQIFWNYAKMFAWLHVRSCIKMHLFF